MTDKVRQAIENSGMTRYRLSKLTGVDQATLSRFVSGECDMALTTLEKLAPAIGVKLTVERPKARKGR